MVFSVILLNPGTSQSHFFFFSEKAFSPFITLGNNGNVIAKGSTVVPAPAALWLFGAALLGLFPVFRRV
ncbi:MAG TPA: hypothetical protein ENJ32_02245 [Crenotrichaceae bacterium]|nr:hypothetical protein [Crenotrichaceae bacterium]